MKNITLYIDAKYNNAEYSKISNGVYKSGDNYYTSLSFVQEPELGEGNDSSNISQYPLEDILDHFCVYVSDFYEGLNNGSTNICYLEFAGFSMVNIQELLKLVGRHVYLKKVKEDDKYFERLCID